MTKSWSAWFTTNTNMEPGITYLWEDFPFLQSLSLIYRWNTSVLLPAAICNTNIIDIDKYWEIRWYWKWLNRFMGDGCLTNFAQLFRRWMGGWQRCQYFEGKLREEKKKENNPFPPQEISWTRGPHMEGLTTVPGSLPPHFLSNDTVKVKKDTKIYFPFFEGRCGKYA